MLEADRYCVDILRSQPFAPPWTHSVLKYSPITLKPASSATKAVKVTRKPSQ